MNVFKSLFGLEPEDVQESCIVLPCINKDLLAAFGVGDVRRGKLYGFAQGDGFTLIHARIGACFAGDIVLYLRETAARQVFLFGSCGSTGGLDIGRLVMPVRCFAKESFSSLLYEAEPGPGRIFYPDERLADVFFNGIKGGRVDKATCMTLPSLKLEEALGQQFKDFGIDVVDMECSAFFAAASKAALPAVALFYVSDIINSKPFYADLNEFDQKSMKTGMTYGIEALCDFLRKSPGD